MRVESVRCASGSSPQNLPRTRLNALWADISVLCRIGLLSQCNGTLRGGHFHGAGACVRATYGLLCNLTSRQSCTGA